MPKKQTKMPIHTMPDGTVMPGRAHMDKDLMSRLKAGKMPMMGGKLPMKGGKGKSKGKAC